MGIWVYDGTPDPAARFAVANGQTVPFLDIADGSDYGGYGEAPGSGDWDGESIIFTGGKQEALRWLCAALVSVAQLPEDDRW